MLLYGQLGIGKSAGLDAFIAATESRVLCCSPTPAHTDLEYFALAELLATVTDEERAALPPRQRRTLTAALEGGARPDGDPVQGDVTTVNSVAVAVWQLLGQLARTQPLLLVVDDMQWLDPGSAEVLRFVAAAVGHLPVQMVAAERVWRGRHPISYELCPPPLLMVSLDPVVATDEAVPYRRVA